MLLIVFQFYGVFSRSSCCPLWKTDFLILAELLLPGLTTDNLFLEDLSDVQLAECKALLKRLREDSLEHSQELLEHTKHVPVVAQLLLEFLKDLPEPLLTYANYDSFLMSLYIKEKSHRTKYFTTLLNTTPPHHVALTTQLLTLLHRLVGNRSVNSLTAELLAPLFAPHFLRPKKICPYMKDDEPLILSVMMSLIDDYDLLFAGDSTRSSATGSSKVRKASGSPYVTDLSQSAIGSGKLQSLLSSSSSTGSSSNLLSSSISSSSYAAANSSSALDPPSAAKGHKRSASTTAAKYFASALSSPNPESKGERDDDQLTADDFSDEDAPQHLLQTSTADVATRAPTSPFVVV